ncbi:RNA-directed DNA polymerase [Microcoleus vaginatus]|uniref:RNA-directed DNA polymerase n=1 Tax=Microcoleus vaginatus TaxID=119532 RepID=UPI0016892768|nr:RNA-directed DNA polymerase [Microcoleus sp. FACHB-84]MBD2011348.1 RNA-directed DNA polymerase [Microcoleus sp. FACHB-45]
MDHIKLLNQVRSKETIIVAFKYALNDRLHNDSYFDHFEIEYVQKFQEKIIEELLQELKEADQFSPRPAYAYYLPKTELCYRRMIYIPFKDLVVRYAFVIVLAKHLDQGLSENCFANRRAKGEKTKEFLLEDYYQVSLPNFRNWQKNCANKYDILIKTDISAFYDSVSHQYLIKTLAEQLCIKPETAFFRLFQKLLCVDVISYCQKAKTVQSPKTLHQGLTIGNNLEGFLANLYLKNIDDAMQSAGIDNAMQSARIEFGRYNDDMRIFAENREIAQLHLLILQDNLLTKGLNLNSSKTKIAENKKQIEKLQTKVYDISPSLYDNSEENEAGGYIDLVVKTNEVQKNIDPELDDLDNNFDPNGEIKAEKDAKNFCLFFSKKLNPQKRIPAHIKKLEIILTHWQGSSKNASWLIVNSIYNKDVSLETQMASIKGLFNVLHCFEALSYTKYRLIHNLIHLKPDPNTPEFRVIHHLDDSRKKELRKILLDLLKQSTFELNIIALYAFRVLGDSSKDIEKYAHQHIPKPIGSPILTVLDYLKELEPMLTWPKTETERSKDSE